MKAKLFQRVAHEPIRRLTDYTSVVPANDPAVVNTPKAVEERIAIFTDHVIQQAMVDDTWTFGPLSSHLLESWLLPHPKWQAEHGSYTAKTKERICKAVMNALAHYQNHVTGADRDAESVTKVATALTFQEQDITAEQSSFEGTAHPGVRIEALEDHAVIGVIEFYLKDNAAYVRGITVAQPYRGQGFGQQLYDRAIVSAKQHGAKAFYSDTTNAMSSDAHKAWGRMRERYDVAFEPGEGGYDSTGRRRIDLQKTARTFNRAWVKPDGAVVLVDTPGGDDSLHHNNVALEYFEDGLQGAISAGWARIGTFLQGGYVNALRLSRPQLHAIQDFLHEAGAQTVVVDLYGGASRVRGQLPFPEFQTFNSETDIRKVLRGEALVASRTADDKTKKKRNWRGLAINIEHPAGTTRHGVSPDGYRWEREMLFDYGHFKGVEGADGDGLDCYVGPDDQSDVAFVVNQLFEGGEFDEHKVMLGFHDAGTAMAAYLAHMPRGWTRYEPVKTLTVAELRHWLHVEDKAAKVASSKIAAPQYVSFDQWFKAMGGWDGLKREYGKDWLESYYEQAGENCGDMRPGKAHDKCVETTVQQLVLEDLKDAYDNWHHRYQTLKTFPMKIYRAVALGDPNALNTQGIGVYWTDSESHAQAHWGHGNGRIYVISAEIDEDAVDWPGTIYANMAPSTGEDEQEIRLKAGAHIRLTGFRLKPFGFGQPEPWKPLNVEAVA